MLELYFSSRSKKYKKKLHVIGQILVKNILSGRTLSIVFVGINFDL